MDKKQIKIFCITILMDLGFVIFWIHTGQLKFALIVGIFLITYIYMEIAYIVDCKRLERITQKECAREKERKIIDACIECTFTENCIKCVERCEKFSPCAKIRKLYGKSIWDYMKKEK